MVRERQNQVRAMRGRPLIEDTAPVSRHDDFTSESLEDVTRRLSGFGSDTEATSTPVDHADLQNPHLNHGLTGREGHGSSIVDRMRASRAAPRGPRQTDWRRQALEQ